MKAQCLALFLTLLASGGNSFAPVALTTTKKAGASRPATLIMASTASEDAVKAAMAAAEKYGKASPEARAAWDIVEEIDAATR